MPTLNLAGVYVHSGDEGTKGVVAAEISGRARLISMQSDGSIQLNNGGASRIVEEDGSSSNCNAIDQSNQGKVSFKREKN